MTEVVGLVMSPGGPHQELAERIEFLLRYGDALSDRIAALEKKIEILDGRARDLHYRMSGTRRIEDK